jgi:Restriction endonuclease
VTGPLFRLLEKRTGSEDRAFASIAEAAIRTGTLPSVSLEEQLAALALCARGESVDLVSRHLSWRDFEGFGSAVLRSRGYAVRENIYLRRPRAQIDIFAMTQGISLAVDCKHWARAPGYGALAKLVEAQKSRAKRLHDSLDAVGPIAVVLLVITDGGARFVGGGAVVPAFSLGDFLDNVEAHRGALELV